MANPQVWRYQPFSWLLGGKPGASKAEDLFGQPHPDQDHEDAVVVYADADLFAVLPVSGP